VSEGTGRGFVGAVVVHLEPRRLKDTEELVNWFRNVHVPEILARVEEIKTIRMFEFLSEFRGDGRTPTKLLAIFEVEGESFESVVASMRAASAHSSGTDLRDPSRVASFVYTEHLPVVFSRTS
jgi:hypothetical protein